MYKGGVEPQLRKVVWKHLLGVYPPGLDGRQRLDYMRQKSVEYDKLKNNWIQVRSLSRLEFQKISRKYSSTILIVSDLVWSLFYTFAKGSARS